MPEKEDDIKSISELFSGLSLDKESDKVASSSDSKFSKLTKREKMEACFDLRMRGVPVGAIAKSFGVDSSTIYRLLKDYTEEYRQRLEQEPAANLLADSLAFLDSIETVCLFESSQIEDKEMIVDPGSGVITPKTGKKSAKLNKLKFIQMAIRAREMKIDLMLDTGLIPREPEKMYLKLKSDTGEEIKTGVERSEDEIKNEIMKLLSKGRSL